MHFDLETAKTTVHLQTISQALQYHEQFGGDLYVVSDEGNVVAITVQPSDKVRWCRQIREAVKTLRR